MVSIPFLKKSKKQSHGEVYIGIFFKEQDGVVMYLEDGKAGLKILGTEHFNYSNGWEQLVDDIDEVLYRLETRTHLAPQKAIFFVYSHFVDPVHKEIKRSFLSKIKELSKSLDLKPLGYIECQEAIVEHLRAKEHAPLHMIMLEFDKTVLTLALYQGGNNIHEQQVARTGDVINTLTPVLKELKEKYVLPNRLILYDEKSVTGDVSTLLSNRWDEDIFPTPPKLDILTQEELEKSLVDVFARQIHGLPAAGGASAAGAGVGTVVSAAAADLDADVEKEDEDAITSDAGDLKTDNIKEDPAEVMGFMIGADEEQVVEEHSRHMAAGENYDLEDEPAAKPKRKAVGNPFKGVKMPRVSLPPMGKILPVIGAVLLILLVVGLGGTEFVLHKAEVKVIFPSKQVDKDVTIKSDMKLDEGTDSRQISENAQTTGQKTIGDKAKGSVTIYNSLKETKTISKGTKLTGPNNLTFVIDADVKVASASGDASDINSSTAKVSAVAGEIGNEYNVSAGTKMNISGESSSDVIAKADGAFSGGSKKQVRVASTTDVNKLRQKVVDDAKKAAAASLKSKVGDGRVIVDDLTEIDLENAKFSKKAGDEAESITLSGDVKTTYYTYDKQKLRDAFTKELSKGLASGTRIQPESIAFRIVKLENKDDADSRVVVFKVVGKAVPVFDRSQLLSKITGKQVSSLDKIVKDGYKANGVEVTNTPRVPPFTMFTPFIKKNIAVDVAYE